MKLFRRGRGKAQEDAELSPIPADDAVQTVAEICETAQELLVLAQEPPEPIRTLLYAGPGLLVRDAAERWSPDDARLTLAAVRYGYATRLAETQTFNSARERSPQFLELIGDPPLESAKITGAVLETALEAAKREEIDPDPSDPFAPSWWVPGLGAQARSLARSAQIRAAPAHPVEVSREEVERIWKFGFFFRACIDHLGREAEDLLERGGPGG